MTFFRYMNEDMAVIVKLPTESPKGTDVFWKTRQYIVTLLFSEGRIIKNKTDEKTKMNIAKKLK